MSYHSCLLEAIDKILAWDISEEAFAEAVHAQACLMAGINRDEFICYYAD